MAEWRRKEEMSYGKDKKEAVKGYDRPDHESFQAQIAFMRSKKDFN